VTIDRAAWPFVFAAAVPALVSAWLGAPAWLTGGLVALPVAIALFFRDPRRTAPTDPALVLSPADGTVMHAGTPRPGEAPPGEWKQVTIFLSVLDVHINRTPVAGRVTRVEYFPGTFRAAFHHDAHKNERSEIWLDHEGTPIVTRQVVGMLARRVVCRVVPGDVLTAGERIGLMKCGSRMDVFVPPSADVLVAKGSTVRAAETAIARLTVGRS
jgi:phosphatidylserine decarboxylase